MAQGTVPQRGLKPEERLELLWVGDRKKAFF